MSASRARYIARRQELLELEAEVQRAALAARLARWERRRVLGWAADASRILFRALAHPRLRWLLVAAAMRGLRRHTRKD